MSNCSLTVANMPMEPLPARIHQMRKGYIKVLTSLSGVTLIEVCNA